MMPIMRSPEGLYVDVPDDADSKELETLGLKPHQADVQTAQAPARTTQEQLMRQLGLTARMAVHGVTGTSGALADAAVGGINAFRDKPLPMPSVAQEQMMNRFLPQPENDTEKAVQGIGSIMGGGAFDPFMGGAARASREMVPAGFQMAARNISPELLKKIEQLGSLMGTGAGGYVGHKLGGYMGMGGGAYVGQKVGKAGGEALAQRLQSMLFSGSPFMGNSPNAARYMTQAPLQWLTPREEERQ